MVYAVTLHASSPTWRHTLETITLLHCGDSLTPQLLSVVLCCLAYCSASISMEKCFVGYQKLLRLSIFMGAEDNI